MTFTPYLANALLDHVTGKATFTPPAAIFVQLHVGDPGDTGTANPAEETRRRAVAFDWAADKQAAAEAPPAWSELPADETFTHASAWDADVDGNCLAYDPMDDPVVVTAGDSFTLPTVRLRQD